MDNRRTLSLTFSCVLCSIVVVALLAIVDDPTLAQGSTLYVAPGGDCGGASPCYAAIQSAVDAATEDSIIKVAQGVYTATSLQVIYVSKAITISGGYTVTNWSIPDPYSQSTIVDAENSYQRRGIFVNGTGVPTITLEGLTIQRGHLENMGGAGVFVLDGQVVLQNSRVVSNTAIGDWSAHGGGLDVEDGSISLLGNMFEYNSAYAGGGIFVAEAARLSMSDCIIQHNAAAGSGGGLYVYSSDSLMIGNLVYSNTAWSGAGLLLRDEFTLTNNTIQNNRAHSLGGGLLISGLYDGERCLVNANLIEGNTAGDGGGVYILSSYGNHVLQDNTIVANRADNRGGGVYKEGAYSTSLTMENNSVLSNTARLEGGGVRISQGRFSHFNTLHGNNISFNSAGVGGGVWTGRPAILTNNTIRGNLAATYGGGIYSRYDVDYIASSGNLLLDNTAGADGGALYVDAGLSIVSQNDVFGNNHSPGAAALVADGSLYASHSTFANDTDYALAVYMGSAILTNTIVASHTVAGFWGPTITADHSLFFNTGIPCGSGASCTNSLTGDPAFLNPAAGDYHVGSTSAALDQGVAAGVDDDFEGDPRPLCSGYEIGADEWVPPPPAAAFTSSNPDWLGQVTAFSNTTPLPACASYEWSFGDGATGSVVSPTHEYTISGSYTVLLTATNYAGRSVVTDTVDIYGASFTSSNPDWLGQITVFTNTTFTSGTTTYQWNLGDQHFSVFENPTHTYVLPGVYAVVLTATSAEGSGTECGEMAIYGPPVADFAVHPTQGVHPLTVTFTDTTTTTPPGDPTLTYLWQFGDGQVSTLRNPVHVYDQAGCYTVTLAVTNAAGSQVITRAGYITVYESVDAQFTADPTSGVVPLTITFTNTSTGDYATCTWDFGDSGSSNGCQDTSHLYVTPGVFTVSLTVSGAGGVDTMTHTGYITVHEPVVAAFAGSPTSGAAPLEVTFVNESGGDYVDSLWDFGDGVTSTVDSPTHVYTAAGVYTVSLTASGPGGEATETKTAYITVRRHFAVYLPVVLRQSQ